MHKTTSDLGENISREMDSNEDMALKHAVDLKPGEKEIYSRSSQEIMIS